MKTAIDIRRWRNGYWSVTARNASHERCTLVQGKRGRSARVVVVDAHRCNEATAQTALFARGLGWAVGNASMDAHGWSGGLRRIFPDGTIRVDHVRRIGTRAQAEARWMFKNGSRAEQSATAGRLLTRLFDRAGHLVRTHAAEVARDRGERVAARFTIADGDGNVVGHGSTTRTSTQDGTRASLVAETDRGVVTAESSSDVTSDGRRIGREVTKNADGSRTVAEWTHYDDGSHEQTEVTTSGDSTTTTKSVTTPNADGSTSTHTETTIEQGDGSVTRTVSDSRATADGVTTDSTTTRDGETVGRSSTSADAEGNTSTASVYYNPDGSGEVVVTSRDKDGNVSSSVDQFDPQGNPVAPSGGGSSGAPAGGGPSGGGADPDGGEPEGNASPGGGQPEGRGGGGPSGGGSPGGGDGQPSGGGSPGGGDGQPSGGGSPGGGDGDQGGGPPDPEPGGGGGERPADDGSGGGDEGPHLGGRFGPYMVKGLESLASDDEGDGEGGAEDQGPDYGDMHGSLVHDVGAGGPPIDPEGGGWGQDDGPDGTDGTGAPTFHFSADASVLAALGGRANTEDWGDFNDPRVLVALTASVMNVTGDAALGRALDAMSR